MGGRPSTRAEDVAAAFEQLNSGEGLGAAWLTWRDCDVVHCVVDGAPIALNVDGGAGTYRFVCTHCGSSSAWFEAKGPEPQTRPPTPSEGFLRASAKRTRK